MRNALLIVNIVLEANLSQITVSISSIIHVRIILFHVIELLLRNEAPHRGKIKF